MHRETLKVSRCELFVFVVLAELKSNFLLFFFLCVTMNVFQVKVGKLQKDLNPPPPLFSGLNRRLNLDLIIKPSHPDQRLLNVTVWF